MKCYRLIVLMYQDHSLGYGKRNSRSSMFRIVPKFKKEKATKKTSPQSGGLMSERPSVPGHEALPGNILHHTWVVHHKRHPDVSNISVAQIIRRYHFYSIMVQIANSLEIIAVVSI